MAEISQSFQDELESLWNFCHTPILPRVQFLTEKVKYGVCKLLRLTVRIANLHHTNNDYSSMLRLSSAKIEFQIKKKINYNKIIRNLS